MNAVPSCAALAPAASTAAIAPPVASPPGRHQRQLRPRRATSCSAARTPRSGAVSSSAKNARCPPASAPWTTSASAPASRASRASAGPVTVTHTSLPAACTRSTTAASGHPNVNDTTGTRSPSSERELRVPVVVVVARLAELALVAQRARVGLDGLEVDRAAAGGANTLSPNGRRSARAASRGRRARCPPSCSRRRGSRAHPPPTPRRRAPASTRRRPAAPARSAHPDRRGSP